MDRFDAMQVFARVVETGSFTKAAETLQISRATATQLVQQLETRLQAKLLNRTTRKVALTETGAAFYERTLRLLAELDDVESSVSMAHGRLEGRLRIDVPSPLARLVLVPALPTFHERHPHIRIDMRVSDWAVDLLDENIDCVIRGGPIADPSLIARHLGELSLHAYAAPAYLQHNGMPRHPAELEGPHHRVVGYLWAHRNQRFPYAMRRDQESLHIRGNYLLAVDDGNAYLEAGIAGLGVVWLPDYMARLPAARGALQRVLTDWQTAPMSLHAAFHPSRRSSAKLQVFVDWVAMHVAALR